MKHWDEDAMVFIVRLWREPREIPGAPPELRGSVEHLASGTRRYFRKLDSILSFIVAYVDSADAEHHEESP